MSSVRHTLRPLITPFLRHWYTLLSRISAPSPFRVTIGDGAASDVRTLDALAAVWRGFLPALPENYVQDALGALKPAQPWDVVEQWRAACKWKPCHPSARGCARMSVSVATGDTVSGRTDVRVATAHFVPGGHAENLLAFKQILGTFHVPFVPGVCMPVLAGAGSPYVLTDSSVGLLPFVPETASATQLCSAAFTITMLTLLGLSIGEWTPAKFRVESTTDRVVLFDVHELTAITDLKALESLALRSGAMPADRVYAPCQEMVSRCLAEACASARTCAISEVVQRQSWADVEQEISRFTLPDSATWTTLSRWAPFAAAWGVETDASLPTHGPVPRVEEEYQECARADALAVLRFLLAHLQSLRLTRQTKAHAQHCAQYRCKPEDVLAVFEQVVDAALPFQSTHAPVSAQSQLMFLALLQRGSLAVDKQVLLALLATSPSSSRTKRWSATNTRLGGMPPSGYKFRAHLFLRCYKHLTVCDQQKRKASTW